MRKSCATPRTDDHNTVFERLSENKYDSETGIITNTMMKSRDKLDISVDCMLNPPKIA